MGTVPQDRQADGIGQTHISPIYTPALFVTLHRTSTAALKVLFLPLEMMRLEIIFYQNYN